jgi:copper chaperone CopZ
VSKSLRRLDAVQNATADLKTQTATVTFRPGQPVDFAGLANAVDNAGFKAGRITIWATGTLREGSDGHLVFTVSGTNQTLPVADSPQVAKLKSEVGKELSLVGTVQFTETPPRLIVGEESTTGGMPGMGGMKGM